MPARAKIRIAVIPGDGIGQEVIREAVKVLKTLDDLGILGVEIVRFRYGAEEFLQTGVAIPDELVVELGKKFDGIILGTFGDPRIPDYRHARIIHWKLHQHLGLKLQYRPIRLLNADLSPVKQQLPEQVRFHLMIDINEGFRAGLGGVETTPEGETIALENYLVRGNDVSEFLGWCIEFAESHGLRRIVLAEKSTRMRHAHGLWVKEFESIGTNHKNLDLRHIAIDALISNLFRSPSDFDIIVTPHIFGDILSEVGAILQGGIGLAATGYINPGKAGVFKPVHGAAPSFAGKNIANPLGAVLAVQMLLEFLGKPKLGQLIEDAVRTCIDNGWTTHDIGGSLGTDDVGDYICQAIERLYREGG